MSNILQYDLFEAFPSEVEELKAELKAVRESSDKVRKGLFARHNELAKLYLDAHQRLEILERNICYRDISQKS